MKMTEEQYKKKITTLEARIRGLKGAASRTLGKGFWGLKKEKEDFSHEEIVFLFARIFNSLAFDYVKEIKVPFPDCVCIEDNDQKGIEFEVKLSDFSNHLNSPNLKKCQYIVCWENDLDSDNPLYETIKSNNIGIIELKRKYDEGKIKSLKSQLAYSDRDLLRLSDNAKKILRAFIASGKNELTRDEIKELTELQGQGLGGALSGFTQRENKEWLVRRKGRSMYSFNTNYKDKIELAIGEGYI